MRQIENFFIFCSGADRSILSKSSTEYNKYVGIGATVFFTGLFAMIASNYALYTVFDNIFISSFFGLVWGLLIFNLDRYIVSTIKKKGNFFRDFTSAFPRIVMAVLISIVISKPLELKIFETEINAEITSMQQEKRKVHEDLLKARYNDELNSIDSELLAHRGQILQLEQQKTTLTKEALVEADGTGGSKIRNMGPIYKAKQDAAVAAETALLNKTKELSPKITLLEARKEKLIADRSQEMSKMEFAALSGFASRLEALSRLSAKSQAIFIASIFLLLLFVAIETAPVFVKLISERAPYDYYIDEIEVAVEMNHKEITSMRKMEVANKLDLEQKTRLHKNAEIINAENELFTHAINTEVDQIKQSALGLKDYLQRGKILREQSN